MFSTEVSVNRGRVRSLTGDDLESWSAQDERWHCHKGGDTVREREIERQASTRVTDNTMNMGTL